MAKLESHLWLLVITLTVNLARTSPLESVSDDPTLTTTTNIPTTSFAFTSTTSLPSTSTEPTAPTSTTTEPSLTPQIPLSSLFYSTGQLNLLPFSSSSFEPSNSWPEKVTSNPPSLTNRNGVASALLDYGFKDPDGVRRKMKLLEDVQANVDQLFKGVTGRRKDGLPGEIFNQLRTRSMEKIFNLRFMLQLTDRLVNERNQLERIADLFVGLASKRTTETETLVEQIHRTAAELGENIKTDLTRVMRTLDGGLFGLSGLFSNLFTDFETNMVKFKL